MRVLRCNVKSTIRSINASIKIRMIQFAINQIFFVNPNQIIIRYSKFEMIGSKSNNQLQSSFTCNTFQCVVVINQPKTIDLL